MAALLELLHQAWNLYATSCPAVVKPSIPILWFGDSGAYLASPVRVVTVGLNPSRLEFPEPNRFLRFPIAQGLGFDRDSDGDRADHIRALDGYFRKEPYRRWFDQGFEHVLNGLAASYYPDHPSTALHTDLFSPLATDPTWTVLADSDRRVLARGGLPLWHELVRALEPDVIIVSVARRHLDRVEFRRLGPWRVVHTVQRARPFVTEAVDVEIVPSKRTTLVFGRCVSLPFGSVSYEAREAIGAAIGAARA